MSTATKRLRPPVKWHVIPGHPGYLAGRDGSIWSCWRFRGAGYGGPCTQVMSDTFRRLKGSPRRSDGRLRYTLRRFDGRYRRAYGSHFVLEAFVGPRPDGMEACHTDGDCTNDAADNLRWDCPAANKADMVRHGTRQRGEAINTAKLTPEAIRDIRRAGYPLRPSAEKYGVTTTLISLILRRKVWAHVD
jgi:hypothetical protein